MADSAKDSQGNALAIGAGVVTVKEITVPNKGTIPNGTALSVVAFGKSPNHIDVSFGGKTWFIDAACVKKA